MIPAVVRTVAALALTAPKIAAAALPDPTTLMDGWPRTQPNRSRSEEARLAEEWRLACGARTDDMTAWSAGCGHWLSR